MIDLPAGKEMTDQRFVWNTDHIFLSQGEVIQHNILNRKLPKFTHAQIAATLALYRQTPDINDERTIELAERLFMAAIYGNQKARNELIQFNTKFTKLDGAYAEEYDRILTRLRYWDRRKA